MNKLLISSTNQIFRNQFKPVLDLGQFFPGDGTNKNVENATSMVIIKMFHELCLMSTSTFNYIFVRNFSNDNTYATMLALYNEIYESNKQTVKKN